MRSGRMWLAGLVVIVVAASLAAIALGDEDDAKVVSEKTITLDQLPAAVKATVLKETKGFTITELQEITLTDGVVYEAEWRDGEFHADVQVAPDGKVIGREREKADDDEKPGDETKDD
ncbi:MAG TPA: hypothetical protein PLQ13_13505 [Candidatus Krumholzibacteria bacterium]|nr:hypothetical protein [Candidatus Krumholzibacteria bacterium]